MMYGNAIIYEHIIRDNNSYEQITQYIIDNPENWEMDDATTHNFKEPQGRINIRPNNR